MEAPSFRKKPVVIQAIRFDGDNFSDCQEFLGKSYAGKTLSVTDFKSAEGMGVHTLEGQLWASVGDWLIKGVKGEFYPCKPDIFEMTYEKLEQEAIAEMTETILPSDRDPVKMNEVMKDQVKGVEWIKARTEQILYNWNERFADAPLQREVDRTLAAEFADLENDFNYIKDLNTSMAVRYEEVWDCLPSLTEVDALLRVVYAFPEEDASFFCTATKEDRLKKLKKLRSAIAHAMGNK
jgi:hypothetical protein